MGAKPSRFESRPPDPKQTFASVTKGRMSDDLRIYAELVTRQKKERNMIEIKFVKQRKEGDLSRGSRNIELDVISEYIFVELGVKPDEILEVDLNTGRFDTKQILLKPGVDSDKFANDFPDTFGEYTVTVNKMSQTETKVSFRNVPSYIPDLEILNLCSVYGTVEGGVQREKLTMTTSTGKITLPSSNRFVMMKINPGKYFNNYYWLDGPLPGDQGRRVTVLHSNQPQQCSLCLCNIESGCLGMGNGRKCEEMGGVRTKMSDYMSEFKAVTGYTSVKEEYVKVMKRMYNKFEGDIGATMPEDMDQYVADLDDVSDDDTMMKPDGSIGITVNVGPIKKRDNKIAELAEIVEKYEKEVPALKKEQYKSDTCIKKTKEVLEKKMKAIVEEGNVNVENVELTANVYSSLFNEDDFERDEAGVLTISKENFLKEIVHDGLDDKQQSRYEHVLARVMHYLSVHVSKSFRRMSISVKRNKPEESGTPEETQKHPCLDEEEDPLSVPDLPTKKKKKKGGGKSGNSILPPGILSENVVFKFK